MNAFGKAIRNDIPEQESQDVAASEGSSQGAR
jgi:hypothetical protein